MGNELTRFKKGNKAALGRGRPKGFKGLAKKIQRETEGGDELLEFALAVFRGGGPEGSGFEHLGKKFSERWDAFVWLSDRGYGKAPLVIEAHHEGEVATAIVPDLSEFSDEELEAMDAAAAVVERHRKKLIDV